jgi:beta-lactam-binding protein with PASTA domain/serine/threonine protein kinase
VAVDLSSLRGSEITDRFHLTGVVSVGATATVIDGVERSSGTAVTVRVINPALCSDPGFPEEFRRAIRPVRALDHPNIATVLATAMVDTDRGAAGCIVTEALTGGSLRDLLDRGRLLSPSQALALGLDVCRALHLAHSRGLVHTEVTPSKIMFGDEGRARLVDLGLAGLLGRRAWIDPSSLDNHVVRYSAPEQATSLEPSSAADIYALGLVLVEAVTGSVPFDAGSTVATLAQRVDRLMPASADLGPLAAVLEHAARPDPSERWTAESLHQALVAVAPRLPRPEPLPLVARSVAGASTSELPTTRAANEPSLGQGQPDPGRTEAEEPTSDRGVEDSAVRAPAVQDATGEVRISRRRPGWLLPLAAGSAVVLAALLARLLLVTPIHVVPDLRGVTEAEAVNTITPFGWTTERLFERSDAVPTPGTIISTSPAAGVELAEGEPFTYVVSEGPTLRAVPDTSGARSSDAETALSALGLTPYVEPVYDESIPVGVVVSWVATDDPTVVAGTPVEPGTAITLRVSAGPGPRTVPDLVGILTGPARARLVDLGLVLVEREGDFDEETEAGQIVEQNPAAGELIERGAAIAVTVSKGPDVIIFPALAEGIVFADARAELLAAGFEVELVLGAVDAIVSEVLIEGEPPEVDGIYPRGTLVDIVAV